MQHWGLWLKFKQNIIWWFQEQSSRPGKFQVSIHFVKFSKKEKKMKIIIIFVFLIQMIFAFAFVHQGTSNANSIWLQFISKDIMTKNDFKKCAINIHLKNRYTSDSKSVLKYFNQEMFRYYNYILQFRF
jgi:hypothetical protein